MLEPLKTPPAPPARRPGMTLEANIGVFVGLILVAYAIHQSRQSMSLPAYRGYGSRSEHRHNPGFRQLTNDILLELDGRERPPVM